MSNDVHDTILGKTGYHKEQKLVDERFNAESAFWSEAYRRTDVFGINIRRRQAVALSYVEGLSLPKTARVLEIGCGAGFMTVALAQRGFMVDAVDHSSAMIELTQSHAKQKGMDERIHAAIEDAQELPFDDCSFDLIVSLGVIAWLPDLRKALTEIARVLMPGGYFVLSISNPYGGWTDPPLFLQGILKRNFERTGLRNPPNVPHARYYSIKQLNKYLSEAELILTRNTNAGFRPFTVFNHSIFSNRAETKIHHKLQLYVDRGYPFLGVLGSQYIVLAVKRK